MPPKANAKSFAPFFTNTPAQIPHMVPKLSSYTLTDEGGGGGKGAGAGGGVVRAGPLELGAAVIERKEENAVSMI